MNTTNTESLLNLENHINDIFLGNVKIDSSKINKLLEEREQLLKKIAELPNGMIDANSVFEKNGIPEEFRKVIVKINIPFCLKKEAEEYTMGFPFDITGGKIEKVNNKKTISASSGITYDYYANQQFRDKIKFKTELVYSNFDDVMNFFHKFGKSMYTFISDLIKELNDNNN